MWHCASMYADEGCNITVRESGQVTCPGYTYPVGRASCVGEVLLVAVQVYHLGARVHSQAYWMCVGRAAHD